MVKPSRQVVFQVWKQYPAFARFQYSNILTGFTSWGAFLAMLVLLNEITDNGFEFGLLWAVSGIVPMIFNFFSGVWIDRIDVKKSMVIVEILHAVAYFGFVFVPMLDGYKAWALFLLLRFFTGVLQQFNATARQTVIPDIIKKEDLTVANSLNYTITSAIRLSGASLGGILLTVTGMNALWVVNGAAFFVSAWLLYSASKNFETERKVSLKKNFGEDFKAGLQLSQKNVWVRMVLTAGVTCGVMIGSFNLMLQQYVSEIYRVDHYGLSVLYVVEGIVSVLIGYWLANSKFMFKKRVTSGYVYALWGLTWVLFGFSQNLWIGALCLALYGLVGAFNVPYERLTMQTEVPAEFRGRVFGLWGSLTTLSIQIGAFLTGVIMTELGTTYVPVVIGLLEVAFGLYFVATVRRNERQGPIQIEQVYKT
ncbi:putative MFS family arabinose efflux permease [Tumebacillus sp. BK434]|uniref:MFS transporter n=1 Tax=Tumebacillus sp. BK434 TaxID=2512169 RepID=UPI0010EE317A|nr:MFS transporter [Tumebacillus sp. BK434]TCP57891.1 putative MFS family arabinose efflux permease [Tumebacillus sp. BK434]